LASLYLLIKINKEGLGNFFKWSTYLVMLAATVILLCQLARGVVMMRHHFREPMEMRFHEGMNHGGMMYHDGRMGRGCCDENECCGRCDDDGKKCDDDKMKCDHDMMMKDGKESSKDCCKDMKKDKDEKEEKEQKK